MTKPILSLETITELPLVEIDGAYYELLTVDSIPVSVWQPLQKRATRFDALYNKGADRTDDEGAEMERLVDEICRAILKAPSEVHDKLKGKQRLAVVWTFQLLPSSRATLQATRSGAAKRHQSTGVSSSRGSRGSTARRPRRG